MPDKVPGGRELHPPFPTPAIYEKAILALTMQPTLVPEKDYGQWSPKEGQARIASDH